jgi:hypothetical protein
MQINNVVFCKGTEFYSTNRTTVVRHSDINPFAICVLKILAEHKVNFIVPFILSLRFDVEYRLFKSWLTGLHSLRPSVAFLGLNRHAFSCNQHT